jgi:hypothetical protein
VDIQTGKGKIETLKTYKLDIKTLVWFIAKFDANLRASIINYAFEKLQEDRQNAIALAVKEAKKPKVYKNGFMSVRGCIAEAFDDIEDDVNESDVWNALVYNGLVVTKAKVTIKRDVPEELEGVVASGKYSMAVFKPNIVREAYDKWIKAGKPIKSEYERLIEEFAEVSKKYTKLIEEAKGR